MRFTRVSTSVKTAFAFSSVWRHSTCVSHASLHRSLRHNPCVSIACLLRLRRLLRFSTYGVTMYAFHTCLHRLRRLCVYHGMVSQCMRSHAFSASVKTTSAFSLVSRYIVCVSHACRHRMKRLLRFSLVWCHNAWVSNACLHRIMRFLRFLQCIRFTRVSASVKTDFAFGVTMYAFHPCLHRLRRHGVTMHAFHKLVGIY